MNEIATTGWWRKRHAGLVGLMAATLGVCAVAGSSQAGVFTDQNFTGDTDSGITTGQYYTHALTFNADDNVSVNGTVFTGTYAGNVAPSFNTFSIAGTTNAFNGNTNNLQGSSATLINDFVYGGNPELLTLNNLIVGQQYVTTFVNAGFGDPGTRIVNIAASDGGATVYDQNKAGNKNGNLLKYAFTANATSETFTITPVDPGNSFHNYALTNQLVGYKSIFTDNFYLGTNNGDPGGPGGPGGQAFLNTNLPARQGGAAVAGGNNIQITNVNNVQVGNAPTGGGIDRGNYMLAAFGGRGGFNHNFNGSDGLIPAAAKTLVSFDMAPNINAAGDTSVWGAVDVGFDQAHSNGFVNENSPHFGILFRGNGQIQVFDGGTESTLTGTGLGGVGAGSTTWTTETNVTNQLHHFDLVLSNTNIGTVDIYADGKFVSEYTKVGGYGNAGNNYIDLVGQGVEAFDNFSVAATPEPAAFALLGLAMTGFIVRRRR